MSLDAPAAEPQGERFEDGIVKRLGLRFALAEGVGAVPRAAWDAIANPAEEPFDPFLSWDFLEALERAGCASAAQGWDPKPLLAYDATGALIGAMPLYVKSHSYGEFVFDHAWANAFHRAGGEYYPKLQAAVPFTPAPGRRFLVGAHRHRAGLQAALAEALKAVCRDNRLSSVHVTFVTEPEWVKLGAMGFLQRTDQQFHFFNRGYRDFGDFLDALASQKRKNLRKERARAVEGLRIVHLTGADITERDWDAFFRFYMDTGARKWGSPYLNRRFFSLLGERMAERCLLVFAYDGDRPIAGALNLIGSEALYGRYWGRIEDRPFLHFELCYYQAIDFALARGLARVEAGAQGEHKLARGYEPTLTYSAHWIAHPGLRQAVGAYLDQERVAIADQVEALASYTPFKKSE